MGACSSCLGGNRDDSQEEENARLLDDPNSMNYGGFGDATNSSVQGDPQDVQRENEALQKVVAHTSSHLVDIFAMVSQTSPRTPPPVFTGQDARLLQYQDVLAKLPSSKAHSYDDDSGQATVGGNDWLSDDDEDDDDEPVRVVKPSGPILSGFTNIRAAAK